MAAELGADTSRVELRVENDLPARALLSAAEGAWLLVVGSRGLGGFKGLLLGSVSRSPRSVPGADRARPGEPVSEPR